MSSVKEVGDGNRESSKTMKANFSKRILLFYFFVLLVSAAVRFYALTDTGVWLDEAFSLLMSMKSPSEILFHTARDVHPPLYYLMLHEWIKLFGNGVFAARSLSVCFGVLSVVLGIWLSRLLLSQRSSILASVLLAIFPAAVRYSQEVRMYALLGALMLGATIAFVYWLEWPKRKWPIGLYVLLMVAGLYTHYFAALCMLSHWIYIFILSSSRQVKYKYLLSREWWLANSLIVVCFLPWLPSLLNQLDYSRIDWIAKPGIKELVELVWFFLNFSEGEQTPTWIFYGLALMVWGASVAICTLGGRSGKNNTLLVVYVWCPVVVVLLVSLYKPLFYPRYFLFAGIVLPMVVAVALDGISRQSRAGGIIGLLAVMAVELNGVWHVYNKTCTSCHETNQIGALADYVNNRVQPGDGILVLEFFIHLSMVYYVTTDPPPMQYTPKGPDGSSGRPNGYQISTLIQDKADQIYVDNLDSLTTASGRLWLIDAYDRGTLARKLPAHWRLLGTYTFGKEKAQLMGISPLASGSQ
ncbi:glycosyltransferase family 39 protein [Pseudomonas brenneri]|uniref:glycosyltransferase family 39 protein n=1 Tax=Pseudomonas brenneri TaxID=129817 RepID=UPI0028D17B8C|nr:glycosyltransferase family 39 protein [Pseudomonas brenneri]